jgi:hypothetical protein
MALVISSARAGVTGGQMFGFGGHAAFKVTDGICCTLRSL